MPFAEQLIALMAPLRVGDEICPGARLAGASSDVGLKLWFDCRGARLPVEVALFAEGRPFAARSERLLFSYRADAPLPALEAKSLCEAVAARARGNEARVLGELEAAGAEKGPKIREVEVGRLLERAGTPERPFFTLSPYVGCLIGCRFCYAQGQLETVRRLQSAKPAPWGSWVDARANAPEVLAKELQALPPGPIMFCPIVSDPYQAIEARLRLTRRCLEVLVERAPERPVYVLTRSTLIARDADLLLRLPRAQAGMSVPTLDEEAARHFEPRAALISERLATLEGLRAQGIRTLAVVQPMLPGDARALAEALAPRISSASLDVLHSLEGAGEDFAHPRWRHARDAGWQRTQRDRLAAELAARGVAIWSGELPPEEGKVAAG